MKKIIFSLIFTFTLLILSNVESIGQCPSGYSHKLDTLTFNGCLYEVSICFKCAVTHHGEVSINRVRPIPNQAPPCDLQAWQNFNNALTYIRGIVYSPYYYFEKLCSSMIPSPCPDYTPAKFREYFCWKKTPLGFIPCDKEVYCEVTIEYCWKNDEYHSNFISAVQFGKYDCPDYTGKEEYEECFLVNTDCNP
jgi:hypothetical protein